MAGLDARIDIANSATEQLPTTVEKSRKSNSRVKIPRRKFTLITITLLLNILHLGSFVCLFTSIYLIAATPNDKTSIPSEVLTILSAFATIVYTYLHTVISLKLRIWEQQRRYSPTVKRASYVATRLAVSLCILWLLNNGWNMIIVARRPTCLPMAPDLQVWEYGTACRIARLGTAFATISLFASCTLFGVLAAVRRPFEAHLFKHGYRLPSDPFATPTASRGPSPVRRTSYTTEKQARGRRRSRSTYGSTSDSDVETLDLSHSPPPPTIYAPSPQRSVGLGIFTSDFVPPPIPPEFMHPLRASSLDLLPSFFQPSVSNRVLTRPPRLSGQISSPGFVPFSIAPQYSASTWRALHPASPSSLRPISRSHPHLPSAAFSSRSRFSRSSMSLTKPPRIGTGRTSGSVTWSSRSGSSGPEGRGTFASSDENRSCSSEEIVHALMTGTPIPGTTRAKIKGKDHKRTASAPDAVPGADEALQRDRMAIGWKPRLAEPTQKHEEHTWAQRPSVHTKLARIVRSSSAELLSRFGPDSSLHNDDKNPRGELERNIDLRARVTTELPFRRSKSASHSSQSEGSVDARSSIVEAAAAMVSNMPQDLQVRKSIVLHSEPVERRSMWFDEVKNKPLPQIAKL
ncbi:hypothetical protein BDU57DRAFT_120616 [Ampelomyces quisqualis]|uniref:Uncharacterized protein n=1 Tax=Ampelomyces quisqualis TaxID=50730 RepID=A0A6A5QY70_AMPQU|nr:hypothetical protein BDU57DRAFT_120616 [Ampelomyces quisqualis]